MQQSNIVLCCCSNLFISIYLVDGTALGTMLERQPPITDPRETRAKLAGLTPDTKYRVIIHSTTKMGQGDPYYIEVKTNEQSENGNTPDDYYIYYACTCLCIFC